jgi:peptidyl-prolyl cis-trans isomerase B (cyclophilin B)
MAVRRTAWAWAMAVTGLVAAGVASARADVVMPAKWYVKPNEPLTLGFYAGPTKQLHRGDTADVVKQGYTPAQGVGGDAASALTLYSIDGRKLDPKGGAAPAGDPTKVDLGAIYPEIRSGGTYILVWKDAQPLVLENLYNPGQGAKEMARFKDQMGGLSDERRKQIIDQFSPTVLHIVPLEFADIKTDKGEIKATFAYDVAPHTIDNYVNLADQGFYDDTVFHRIIKGFMVQGGDSTGNVEGRAGSGGPGYQIMQEFSDKPHERGVLSMARSSEPNSAGSQFFIMHAKNANLDGQYTAFGQVIDGMDVVDELAKTPVSDSNGTVKGPKPVIESIRILPGTPEMYGLKK